MSKTTMDAPEKPQLSQEEKEFWTSYWTVGSIAAEKAGGLARILYWATLLQANDIGFDIHITNVVPRISGGVTTSIRGHMFFHDLDDLLAILEITVSDLGKSSEASTE